MTNNYLESIRRPRQTIVMWAIIGSLYVLSSDLLLPDNLRGNIISFQLLTKLPVGLGLFWASYQPRFNTYFHPAVFLTMVAVTASDLWLMGYLWKTARYAYPYECIIFEICFTLFIVVLEFRYACVYVALCLAGFALTLYEYPIYGASGSTRMSAALMISAIVLLGRYRLEAALVLTNNINQRLLDLSEHDNLTQLFNKTPFNHRFEQLLDMARKGPMPIAVYMIDIDNFKQLNDTYGHQAGDELLEKVAKSIGTVFRRKDDIVGRFGGDEYIAVTSNITQDLACEMAKKVLAFSRKITLQTDKNDRTISLSLSVGIYWATPAEHDTIQMFIKNADTALYQAKASGRDSYCLYNKGHDEH